MDGWVDGWAGGWLGARVRVRVLAGLVGLCEFARAVCAGLVFVFVASLWACGATLGFVRPANADRK